MLETWSIATIKYITETQRYIKKNEGDNGGTRITKRSSPMLYIKYQAEIKVSSSLVHTIKL